MANKIYYQEDCNLSMLDRQLPLSVTVARDMHML